MTGGNDISLIYPWVNINSLSQDIWGWVDREEASKDRGDIGSPDTTAAAAAARRKLSQGNKDLFCSSRGASAIYSEGKSATFCPIFVHFRPLSCAFLARTLRACTRLDEGTPLPDHSQTRNVCTPPPRHRGPPPSRCVYRIEATLECTTNINITACIHLKCSATWIILMPDSNTSYIVGFRLCIIFCL